MIDSKFSDFLKNNKIKERTIGDYSFYLYKKSKVIKFLICVNFTLHGLD